MRRSSFEKTLFGVIKALSKPTTTRSGRKPASVQYKSSDGVTVRVRYSPIFKSTRIIKELIWPSLIFVGFLLLGFGLAGFVIGGISAGIIYVFKHKSAVRDAETYRKVKSLGNRDYFGEFIDQYVHISPSSISQMEAVHIPQEQASLLKDLLANKGVSLTNEKLAKFLQIRTEEKVYEIFKERISSTNPKDLNDHMKNLLDISGDLYEGFLDMFIDLLGERGITESRENIRIRLQEMLKGAKLSQFEQTLKGSKLQEILQSVDYMDGKSFETLLEKLFDKMGYKVKQTRYIGDQGGDLVISKMGDRVCVQAKRYDASVDNSAVQEAIGATKYYNCNRAMVVTNSEFTKSANELAKINHVELVDGEGLRSMLTKYF